MNCAEKYERDLNLLERGNLAKGKLKYTERNAYSDYQLPRKDLIGEKTAREDLIGEILFC